MLFSINKLNLSEHLLAVMDISERKIVDDLLLSYQEVGGINRIDSANLPSRPAIATLCEDLLQILFPGFLETEAIEAENLEKETAQLLSKIAIALEKEIKRSVRLLNEVNLKVKDPKDLALDFLSELPKIRGLLRLSLIHI